MNPKMVTLTVIDNGDPSVGINANQWELTLPIEDCLDNSYSKTPLVGLLANEQLQGIAERLLAMYATFLDTPAWVQVYVDGKLEGTISYKEKR